MQDTTMLILMLVGHFRAYRKQNMLSSAIFMIVGIQKCSRWIICLEWTSLYETSFTFLMAQGGGV